MTMILVIASSIFMAWVIETCRLKVNEVLAEGTEKLNGSETIQVFLIALVMLATGLAVMAVGVTAMVLAFMEPVNIELIANLVMWFVFFMVARPAFGFVLK